MNDPLPDPPNPDPPKTLLDQANAWRPVIHDIALAVIAVASIITGIMAYFHGGKLDDLKQIGNDTKDVSVDTHKVQKVVAEGTKELVKNELGDSAPAVKRLEATTQPAATQEGK